MKPKILLLLLFLSFNNYAQISVGPKHVGKAGKFKKGRLEKFKNTETIFVLSNIYEEEIYEQIISESWNVTPYKIVPFEDFEIEDYLSDEYSIAHIGAKVKVRNMEYGGGTSSSLYTYVDFIMYDSKSILKKKGKLSNEEWVERKRGILLRYSYFIARFYLYHKDGFVNLADPSKNVVTDNALSVKHLVLDSPEYIDKVINAIYTRDVFHNYKPGYLKNYLQKTNNLLMAEEVYWMFESDYLPELKNLAKNKLYIPSHMTMTVKHNGWTNQDTDQDDDNIHEIFEDYDYEYEIIPEEDLNNKIMNNEELYYLRYVRTNTERFLQVVNSKTGEIVYRNYIAGLLSYKIKSKHIKKLNSKIKKVSKK